MSLEATAWAFEQSGVTPTEKLVLIVLADFHTPDGGLQFSEVGVADCACMTLAELRSALESLVAKGRLRVGSEGLLPIGLDKLSLAFEYDGRGDRP